METREGWNVIQALITIGGSLRLVVAFNEKPSSNESTTYFDSPHLLPDKGSTARIGAEVVTQS
jgi:hypothetical protein